MIGQRIIESIIHRFLHPFGNTLRMIDPRLYELIRWRIAHAPWLKKIIGAPMYQQMLLPFVVRKGDTVLDVGANHGMLTLPLAQLVGRRGAVHAFEPVSRNFMQLQNSIVEKRLSAQVVLNQLAVGNEIGPVTFTVPRERLTEATLLPHCAMEWHDYAKEPWKYTTESCQMITLDQYIEDNHLPNHISFIKIDVEGSELAVIKGARNLLRGQAPPVLMMEVFDEWMEDFGYSPRELFTLLEEEAGYEFYWICEYGLRRVRPADKVIPGVFHQWLDYLCLVPSVHYQRLNIKRYII